ncbi:flagellar biosynthetic protein FliO [Leptospira mayottensis]|uniref:flagellar biosynthetic protein FliO n=1 Tax=Leptospira mayottensis TaxID=1137606 RepID=UPI001575BAC5|nr:flagellar biosynthetic protein FliO [Leptospira mayottensis]
MSFLGIFQMDGRKVFPIFSVLIIFNFTVVSLAAQSERELMDEALKKELGRSSTKDENKNLETNSDVKKTDSSKAEAPSAEVKSSPNNSAETETNPVAERYKTQDEGPGIAGTLFRVVFILGLLCVALYYILKYVSKNREGRLPVRGEMTLLSSMMLGPNKQIQIVDVSGKLLVLGVADNGVNLITEITDIEVKHRILQKKENFQPPEGGFLVTVLEQIKDLNSRVSVSGEESNEKMKAAREEKRKQARKKLDELKEKTSSLESGLFDLK